MRPRAPVAPGPTGRIPGYADPSRVPIATRSVGALAFGTDDAVAKAANGYQLVNLGSTTGALRATVEGWLDAIDGRS